MANKNYIKGRRREYKIKKILENEGWIVTRSAGSFGFADLIAIDKEMKCIKFIQCKPKDFSEKEKKRLEEKYEWINDEFICKFEVI